MQANAYFLPAERAAFIEYARTVGLDASQLLQLLILREVSCGSVFDRYCAGKVGASKRQPRGASTPKVKVTARLSAGDNRAFRTHIAKVGLGPTQAANLIANAELGDRRLERYVRGTRGRSSPRR
jgi:hypothetical protein